jgi:hypothetical protein
VRNEKNKSKGKPKGFLALKRESEESLSPVGFCNWKEVGNRGSVWRAM